EPGQAADEGRLAAPGEAHDHEDLSGGDGEADIPDSGGAPGPGAELGGLQFGVRGPDDAIRLRSEDLPQRAHLDRRCLFRHGAPNRGSGFWRPRGAAARSGARSAVDALSDPAGVSPSPASTTVSCIRIEAKTPTRQYGLNQKEQPPIVTNWRYAGYEWARRAGVRFRRARRRPPGARCPPRRSARRRSPESAPGARRHSSAGAAGARGSVPDRPRRAWSPRRRSRTRGRDRARPTVRRGARAAAG